QNHYNLVYREEEREMVPLCLHEGIGMIPWSPLARGVLARPWPATGDVRGAGTSRATTDEYTYRLYDSPGDHAVVEAVEQAAKARGVPMAQIALAWLLSRPGVVAPIIGATKMAHLDVAIKAMATTLTSEECDKLEAPYRPHGVKGHN